MDQALEHPSCGRKHRVNGGPAGSVPAQTSVLFLSHWQGKAFRSSLIPLCKGLRPNGILLLNGERLASQSRNPKSSLEISQFKCYAAFLPFPWFVLLLSSYSGIQLGHTLDQVSVGTACPPPTHRLALLHAQKTAPLPARLSTACGRCPLLLPNPTLLWEALGHPGHFSDGHSFLSVTWWL